MSCETKQQYLPSSAVQYIIDNDWTVIYKSAGLYEIDGVYLGRSIKDRVIERLPLVVLKLDTTVENDAYIVDVSLDHMVTKAHTTHEVISFISDVIQHFIEEKNTGKRLLPSTVFVIDKDNLVWFLEFLDTEIPDMV
jgi:hypothetical protein